MSKWLFATVSREGSLLQASGNSGAPMAESRWEDQDNWHRIARAWDERGEKRMAWAKQMVQSEEFVSALAQDLERVMHSS